MSQIQELNWETFISMVNYMSYKDRIPLTKLDRELLRCYWDDLNYQQIFEFLEQNRAKLNYYYNRDYYFKMEIEYNLWKKLSKLIGHSINKSNFKDFFQQIWERDNRANLVKIECLGSKNQD